MMITYSWRITKYDPAKRNSSGHYLLDDWTSIADIGRSCSGRELTYQEYLLWESRYVQCIFDFLAEAGLSSLEVTALEKSRLDFTKAYEIQNIAFNPVDLKEEAVLSGRDLEDVLRLILREVLWCKLVGESFYVHFGYDYYLYIGSMSASLDAVREAMARGLFVEMMLSPYL